MKTAPLSAGVTLHEIRRMVEPLRRGGKTLVTTNGCFDLLHAGHIAYLIDASLQGDILVVGINSDRSVTNLKGPSRPVQNEHDRALLVGALKMVDYVFVFHESNPRSFLETLRPDVHVKGGDYTPAQMPETEVVERYGGKVVIVPFLKGYSTSGIIDRVSDLPGPLA